jgi:hypothetical protein
MTQGSGFTCLDLERALAADMRAWLRDVQLKSPEDKDAGLHPIGVIAGFVPSYYAGPEVGLQSKAPYVSVRCTNATYQRIDGVATVEMVILTWDPDPSRAGYGDVSTIMSLIVTGLFEQGIVGNSFPLLADDVSAMEVTDPSKDWFPYFAGVVHASFGLQTPGVNEFDPTQGFAQITLNAL